MDDLIATFFSNLIGRLTGPMTLRLILQPASAMLNAVRDGIEDAREGRPAYFWTIFTDAGERRRLLREGWKSVSKVMAIGAVMDAIYQLFVFRSIHPVELIVVVLVLAFVPYLLARGPVNRIARLWVRPKALSQTPR